MKINYFKLTGIISMICFLTSTIAMSQVSIGTETPDASSILDLESTTAGLLIPRMTTAQRDAIASPADALQIYNITNKSTDIYIDGVWKSFLFSTNPSASSNLVSVYSLSDLPTPASGGITLDATKMYVFSGMVDISPNYITINGAGLRGTDPQKDGVMSSVSGAVLRSTNTSIFMQNFTVIPFGGTTKAYDFSDTTGTKFCNIFSGCSVVQIGSALGVGQVSGFKAITFIQNYWNVTDGLKVTGNVGKFTASYCFVVGITSGSGIELLSGLTVDDIDMANNYFIYSGQTGIKLNVGATVDRGRLTTNMFRGVTTPLSGLDSYTPGWKMQQNTNVPDTRAYSFIYFNSNATATSLPVSGTFYKIAGATTMIKQQRFTTGNNKLTYIGREPLVGRVLVVIGAISPSNSSSFTIAIAKNGTVIPLPAASMGTATNNQSFQITFNTEVDMVTNDYIEVFIKSNNGNSTSLTVSEMQFRVSD